MTLLEDVKPRCSPADEINAGLAEARVEPELWFGVVLATREYNPKWEAVLILGNADCPTISIVGHRRSELVESIS